MAALYSVGVSSKVQWNQRSFMFATSWVNDHITPHCLVRLQLEPIGAQIQHDTSEMHFSELHCTVLHHCIVLYCTLLHCTELHCTAMHCSALH